MARTKEEVKRRLNELAANKDYAGMVAFCKEIGSNAAEELVNQATNDKGQNLFANYQHTVDAIAAEKKIKAENNRKVENPELEKPKTMNNMN